MDINPLTILLLAPPMILAITLHESAHAYVADYFGDPTARKLGRISLNPMVHIDWFGTLLLPALLYFMTNGTFSIGYAKPVPVLFGNLRNPKKQMGFVALAGPVANLFMALCWAILLTLLVAMNPGNGALYKMVSFGVMINCMMFAFNLFPLPPLDGGRILTALLPLKYAQPFARIEVYGFFIVMILVATKILDFWMKPVVTLVIGVIQLLISPLKILLN